MQAEDAFFQIAFFCCHVMALRRMSTLRITRSHVFGNIMVYALTDLLHWNRKGVSLISFESVLVLR